jgi:hypothetical protein
VKVIDPGHGYLLDQIDEAHGKKQELVFVKRDFPTEKYPGNIGHYPGTTIQEVLRACIDRLHYVNNQQSDARNLIIIHNLRLAIWFLELRAAAKHGRILQAQPWNVEQEKTCPACGHIECKE